MLLYYRCVLGFFMLIVHILTNLHLHMADTMQFYIKQTHWITLMQICTNEKKLVLLSVSQSTVIIVLEMKKCNCRKQVQIIIVVYIHIALASFHLLKSTIGFFYCD